MQAYTLHNEGKLEQALPYYKRILQADPTDINALYGLGLLCWQNRDLERALRLMLQVVARKPAFADAHYNLGVVYEAMGDTTKAWAAYEEAVRRRPDFGDAWEGLGKQAHAMGHPAEAVLLFEKALAVSPPSGAVTAERKYNASYPLMTLGRWKEGWEMYEARFESPVFRGNYVLRHHEPLWDGSPLDGRRLLVHAEQGFGDSIMMARWINAIEGDVHIEVQKPLVRLFKQSFPNRTVTAQGEEYPRCDCQVAMMSLAHRFGMTAENVPTSPWLVPPGEPKLPDGDGLKVGFVYAGSPQHRNDKRRSIPLTAWKPLFEVPGVTWYCLQVDEEPVAQCHILKPLITDFADTAALINQLDLVICVDTSVAHLTGAIGKPCWILLPTIPDYRWGLQSTETCWYPNAHLVRQEVMGDWTTPMREMADGLRQLTEQLEAA